MSSFLTRGTKENRAATEESDEGIKEGRKEDYLSKSKKHSAYETQRSRYGAELGLSSSV